MTVSHQQNVVKFTQFISKEVKKKYSEKFLRSSISPYSRHFESWTPRHLGTWALKRHLETQALITQALETWTLPVTQGTLVKRLVKGKGEYHMNILYLKTTDETDNALKFRREEIFRKRKSTNC